MRLIEAAKYNVLPLDDRYNERINPKLAGRRITSRATSRLFPGMKRLPETSVLNFKNKSFQITAQLVVPDGGANGTIFAQGSLRRLGIDDARGRGAGLSTTSSASTCP